MGDRITNQFTGTLEKSVVKLFGSMTIGASGAVTSSQGGGIASVDESGTGTYTITLADKWSRLLNISIVPVGTSASTVFQWRVDKSVSDAQSDILAKTIVLQAADAAGADVEPASGEVFLFEITVRNSSYGPFDA